MKTNWMVIAISLFLAIVNQANAANFCSDIVVDEAGKLSTAEYTKVYDAAKMLQQSGVDVRVDLVKDLHGQKSLDDLKANLQSKCSSWRSKDGGMKNNLLVFMVTTKPSLGIYYGDGLKSKITPHERTIRDNMNAKFRDGDFAGFLVSGLNDITSLAQIKVSHEGKPITINQPTDFSGFWKFLGWSLGFLVVCCIVLLLIKINRERERRRTAQSNAATERARCTTAINGFETPFAVLIASIKQSGASESKRNKLINEATSAKAQFNRASASFAALDRGKNDPSISNLSVDEYDSMANRYSDVADNLEAAINEIGEISDELKRPERKETIHPVSPASNGTEEKGEHEVKPTLAAQPTSSFQTDNTISGNLGSGHTTVRETTIINNSGNDGFLTGFVIGDVLNDHGGHNHHHERDNDSYREPVHTSQGFGHEEEIGRSSSGSGHEEEIGRSSSGSGHEEDVGNSSSGSGREEEIDSPDFGRNSDPEPDPDPEPSNCDCDCNCDCGGSDD